MIVAFVGTALTALTDMTLSYSSLIVQCPMSIQASMVVCSFLPFERDNSILVTKLVLIAQLFIKVLHTSSTVQTKRPTNSILHPVAGASKEKQQPLFAAVTGTKYVVGFSKR